MTADNLLETILPKLDRGGSPDSRFPDHKGEYWALCPFHPGDSHPTNFSVSERGFNCFACGKSGGLHDLAAHLGCALRHLDGRDNTPPLPSTLENYAQVKGLPVDFLVRWACRPCTSRGSQR